MGQVAVPLTCGAPGPRPRSFASVSSIAAPVLLIGGWSIAGAVQPPGYDALRQTISALAAHGATHRWIMTTGLLGLGLAHLVTAAGLRGARRWTRVVLAVAGAATLGVAVFAEPAHGSSSAHAICATVAFVLLALWPATLARSTPPDPAAQPVAQPAARPWPQRRAVALAGSVVSLGLLVWFATTLATRSAGPLGGSERLLSAQQALWPLLVVATARRRRPARLDP